MSRRFRICMAKGGRESARPSYGRPKLTLISREKNHLRRCYKKLGGHNFDFRAKSSWEKIFNIYKNFLSGGFCSKVKIAAGQAFPTPPYFCWQLAFYRHLPTAGRQNTVQNGPQPLFVQKAFFPLCIPAFSPFMAHHNISLRFRDGGRRVKKFHFSRISIARLSETLSYINLKIIELYCKC